MEKYTDVHAIVHGLSFVRALVRANMYFFFFQMKCLITTAELIKLILQPGSCIYIRRRLFNFFFFLFFSGTVSFPYAADSPDMTPCFQLLPEPPHHRPPPPPSLFLILIFTPQQRPPQPPPHPTQSPVLAFTHARAHPKKTHPPPRARPHARPHAALGLR